MNKSLITGMAAIGILGSSLSVTSVMAQGAESGQDRMVSMVQTLAEKLGVSEDQVQAAFDEVREEHRAEKEAERLTQLDQLVEDGSITEEQQQLILAKQEELQADRETQKESMQDLTEEERQTARESEREAIESWADENGIDMQYLMPDRGQGGDGGPGARGGQTPARPTAE